MQSPTGAQKQPVVFELEEEAGRHVFVAGDFNSWSSTKDPLRPVNDNGKYATTLLLSPGPHQYKFVVDGRWHADTTCPEWAPDGCGSLNSVIVVD